MRRFALTALIATLPACVGELVELTPPDGSGSFGDMAGRPSGGDGGTQSVKFNPDIQLDIHNLGCAAATCHGGTQIPVLKDATDTATVMQNYTNFLSEANMGVGSPVLTKNLASSGVTHGGGKPFSTQSDPI